MPAYDVRCADCRAEREIRTTPEIAAGLELICVGCGGVMRRVFSAGVQVMTRSAPLPEPSRPRRRRGRGGDSCDSAIRLTGPNPFAGAIRRSEEPEM